VGRGYIGECGMRRGVYGWGNKEIVITQQARYDRELVILGLCRRLREFVLML
jgi:hypothetical protein